jgi:hypothetical protein
MPRRLATTYSIMLGPNGRTPLPKLEHANFDFDGDFKFDEWNQMFVANTEVEVTVE